MLGHGQANTLGNRKAPSSDSRKRQSGICQAGAKGKSGVSLVRTKPDTGNQPAAGLRLEIKQCCFQCREGRE